MSTRPAGSPEEPPVPAQAQASAPHSRTPAGGKSALAAFWRRRAGGLGPGDSLGLLAGLGLLVLVFSLSTQHFFSRTTFLTLANQIPAALLVATAMTWVLALGEIDLSVGSVLGLSSAVLGVTVTSLGWPIPAATGAALAAGLLCGLVNAAITLRWRLPSFIVTLGMLEMARGGAHAITGSQTQYIGAAIGGLAETKALGLSLPFLIAMTVVAASQLALTRTVFGRYVVAIGTNPEAVRLSGIAPRPIQLGVFVISGGLVGLAAIVDTSRLQSASPNAGSGHELQAIAAAVIGGTSLLGGRGSMVGTLLGVIIIAVLNAGLAALGARDETKRLVTGAVIIAAVILDQQRQRAGHEAGRSAVR